MARRNRQDLNTVNRQSRETAPVLPQVTQSQNVIARRNNLGGFINGLLRFNAGKKAEARREDARELAEAKREDAAGEAQRFEELVGVEDDRITARAEIREKADELEVKQSLLDTNLDIIEALNERDNDPDFDIREFAQELIAGKVEALAGNSKTHEFQKAALNLVSQATLEQQRRDTVKFEKQSANQISQLYLTALESPQTDLQSLFETMRSDGAGLGLSRPEVDEIVVNASIPLIRQGRLDIYEAMSKDRPRNAGAFTKDPTYSAALEAAKVAGERAVSVSTEQNKFAEQYTKARAFKNLEQRVEAGEWPQEDLLAAVNSELVTGSQVVTLEEKFQEVQQERLVEATIRNAFEDGRAAALLNNPDVTKTDLQKTYDVMVDTALASEDPAEIAHVFDVGDRNAFMASGLKQQLEASMDFNDPAEFIKTADQVLNWYDAGHQDYLVANMSDRHNGRIETYRLLTRAGLTPEAVVDRMANANVEPEQALGQIRFNHRDIRAAVEEIADGGWTDRSITHIGDVDKTFKPLVQIQLMNGLGIESAIEAAEEQWKKTYTRVGSFIARRDANVPSEFPKAANDFLENILPGKLKEAGLETDDDYTLGLSSVPGKFVIYPINAAGGTLIDPKTKTAVMLDAVELTEEWRLRKSQDNQSSNRIFRENLNEFREDQDGRD